jgi:Ferritin-like domain
LKTLGMASAAVGVAVVTGRQLKANPDMPTVVDVLQFALNLEYLEAEFYTEATVGKTIDQVGVEIGETGMPGATTGGSMVNFANNLVFSSAIAMEIAQGERDHVTLIPGALMQAGITLVAKPAINLAASLWLGFLRTSASARMPARRRFRA